MDYPPEIGDLRELTRYRQKLVCLRTSCKDQVHAVLAKLGIAVACSDLFGAWGTAWLDGLRLPGIGAVLAAVIIAEIGDVTRFRTAAQLARWAGLTPKHRESDASVTRGHVTKQGSRLLRWALIEAIQRARAGSWPGDVKDAIIARRGTGARNVAKVAAARRLLTLACYGLHDGQIRCLPEPARAG